MYNRSLSSLTPDNRKESPTSLKDVVGIVFFAVLAGNDEWTEIADFAVDEKETLQKSQVARSILLR